MIGKVFVGLLILNLVLMAVLQVWALVDKFRGY